MGRIERSGGGMGLGDSRAFASKFCPMPLERHAVFLASRRAAELLCAGTTVSKPSVLGCGLC